MREMILNHSSFVASDVDSAVDGLRDIAIGMALLVEQKCVDFVLRTKHELHQINLIEYKSVYDILLTLRRRGFLEEFRFIAQLVTKTPLMSDLPATVVDKFLGCETVNLSGVDGDPLVLCVHNYGVSISFPFDKLWDKDIIEVQFAEILPDETMTETKELVDNLARSNHARPIVKRHQSLTRSKIDKMQDIWLLKDVAFPDLEFGKDVEKHLQRLQPGLVRTLVNRLNELNAASATWSIVGGSAPAWQCKVTPESSGVENNSELREARRFCAASGLRELFLWHARFGSAYRIHIRVEPASRTVEVGYIGVHLPL